MSIKVMSQVWEHSRAAHGALLVLLAIADFADNNGEAFPSIATLADKSRLSERKVQVALRELEEMGELTITQKTGPHGRHCFVVMVGKETNARVQNIHPEETAPRRNCGAKKSAEGVQNFRVRGAEFSSPLASPYKVEPSIEPSEEPSVGAHDCAPDPPQTVEKRTETVPPSRSKSGNTSGVAAATKRTSTERRADSGFRLPADWQPGDADRDKMAEECPDLDLDRATVEFHDYWAAIPGEKGKKLDWTATWRNAMRSAYDRGKFLKTGQSRAAPGTGYNSAAASYPFSRQL